MKKGPEIPVAAVWGIVGVIVVLIGYFVYSQFVSGPPKTNVENVSVERLSDPDPRSPEGQKLKEQMQQQQQGR